MNELSDEELIDRYGRLGERCCFDELVTRHISRVRGLIYPMVLNDADADDLTQEVWLRVANNLERFRGQSRFNTWLHRITMNTTYSFLKQRTRNPVDTCAEVPEQPQPADSPDGALLAGEMDCHIEQALKSLSPSLRAAITLTAIHGLSIAEAAKADDCLIATMYWRVHAARRSLKNKLSKYRTT